MLDLMHSGKIKSAERRGVGIEIDPSHFDLAVERLTRIEAELAEGVSDGT